MDHRPQQAPNPDSGARISRRRVGLGSRPVLAAAFGVSALIHLLVVILYTGFFGGSPERFVPFRAPSSSASRQGGMDVIRVVEIDASDDLEEPDEPVTVPDAAARLDRPPATPALGPEGAQAELVAPGPSAAERLRPDLKDPRLWGRIDPALLELTLEQREELALAGRLEIWRDSVLAAQAAQAAATDWTYTDGEGGKWGVSPGKLHLGDLTIPLPFSFGTMVGQRDAIAERQWEWAEIQRGQITGELRDSWKERAQAIRERRDRERAARPDTSGVRRRP